MDDVKPAIYKEVQKEMYQLEAKTYLAGYYY